MKKEDIPKILPIVRNKMDTVEQYDGDLEYNEKKILECTEKVRKYLVDNNFNLTDLDVETAELLGFRKLSEESEIYLIPLWIYPLLPNGFVYLFFYQKRCYYGENINKGNFSFIYTRHIYCERYRLYHI